MDYCQMLLDAGMKMLASGLTVETWGNISIRDPESGLIYVTPSGMPYSTLHKEDIVVMNSSFEVVEGFRRPTIEHELHIRLLNRRKDINAIIHTHPVYSQVFALLHEDIPAVIDEAAQVFAGPVKCAEYALPGSGELAENVDKAMGDTFACLMANHGAVCMGADIDAAFKACTVLEMTARIYYMARCIGTPVPLKDENIKIMRSFALNQYGQVGQAAGR